MDFAAVSGRGKCTSNRNEQETSVTPEALIDTYGYPAIPVMGGSAAHRGYLELLWVILPAPVGTLFRDKLYFFLGRRHSEFILAQRPSID
jgi:hypothetical protein